MKNSTLVFTPLRVEDAGGQAQDGVQVALVHQVAADVAADVALEQHVVGQHHGGAATGLEATVDVLQEGELFVAGGVGKVIAAGQAAAFLGAERWVGQDQGGLGQRLAFRAERVAVADAAVDAVQHQVHHRQAVGVLHMFHAIEGAVVVFLLLRFCPAFRLGV